MVRFLGAPVALLGDSVNHTPCATDTNRAPISSLLARRLTPRVAGIFRGGDLRQGRDLPARG